MANKLSPEQAKELLTPPPPAVNITRVSKEHVKSKVAAQPKTVRGHKPAELELTSTPPKTGEWSPDLTHKPEIKAKLAQLKPETLKVLFTEMGITNTTQYPFSCIGLVVINIGDSAYSFSGCMIGPNYLITVGHLIPWGKSYGLRFFPGYNHGSQPFGSANGVTGYGYNVDTNSTLQDDYIVYELDSSIGNKCGWMGFGYIGDNLFRGAFHWQSAGYPLGDAMVYATDIGIGNIEDSGGSTQLDTDVITSNIWTGGPFYNTGDQFVGTDADPSSYYVMGVFAGSEISYGGFPPNVNQYDSFVGGQDMFNLGIYAINNYS